MTVSIDIQAGSQQLGRYNISDSKMLLGRSQMCDIVIPSNYTAISSKHMSLKSQKDKLWIQDGDGTKGSTNGVYINGGRVTPGSWVCAPEGVNIILGNPQRQGCIQIKAVKQQTTGSTTTTTTSQAKPLQTTSAPVPVQLTNAGVNVALVRPARERSGWKTPANLLVHFIGLGICVAIMPAIMGSALEAGIVIAILIALEIYFLPTTVSFNRDQPNRFAILALNLFLGWTLIGWVVSLVWSLTAR